MASLTIKKKSGNKFEVVDLPDMGKIHAGMLKSFSGHNVVAEHDNDRRRVYGVGNENLRGKWCDGKHVMTWEEFCYYWQYVILDYALDAFSQLENREERRCICEADNVPEETIQQIFEDRPDLYGTQADLFGGSI